MSAAAQPAIRAAGETHVGSVRTANEDSMILEPQRGLFVVLDGMGGANAGDIASQTARDAMLTFLTHRRGELEPKALLEAAIQAGSAAVFEAAQARREHHGMGTTVVACLLVDGRRAVVAHVGDSRAYLLRDGRLQALTRDHTIVEELVIRGLLSPDEAERHPYKNVLSRNLGSRPETRVDVLELDLAPGDRLLLCSDGLYGYGSAEAIQYLLGSGDAPEHVAKDLVELALRGGGGDNVTVIVLEVPQPAATATQLVQAGARAWWQRRQRFLQLARERGLLRNPIVRGLDPDEALDLVAHSLCEAVFHDLEKATGVNVWTFAQNLGGGWFERGGAWEPLRELVDTLGECAHTVVGELRTSEPQLGYLIEIAVNRALVVAELALGGLLAERLQAVESDLIELHTAQQPALEPADELDDTGERFVDRPTIPFLRPERPVTSPGVTAEVVAAIANALTIARARTAPRATLVREILGAVEAIASEAGESFGTAVLAARELYGIRAVDDQGIMPLFDALDEARIVTAASVQQIRAPDAIKARALRAISAAHQRLVSATTGLVLEAAAPATDKLREVQAVTSELRDQVARAERRRADLERRFATMVDPSLPWGSRGTTEW